MGFDRDRVFSCKLFTSCKELLYHLALILMEVVSGILWRPRCGMPMTVLRKTTPALRLFIGRPFLELLTSPTCKWGP